MKKIIICCDGTWNTPDMNENGIPIATNVVKIAESVQAQDDNGDEQLLYYDTGVGSSGSWLKRVFDGATGSGLSQNILEAYQYLINTYERGDELFFFGFSRGAFTVRSLAGLIRNCGILRFPSKDIINQAYSLYRSQSKATSPKEREATLFRKTYSILNITPIKFIGVLDTVGALGNPLVMKGIVSRKNRFHDTDLSSTVENAYHAVAIDEKRKNFQVALWHKQAHAVDQAFEQRWFVGVHSNIGGGYLSTGLSDIALNWLVEKAIRCRLKLNTISTKPDPTHPVEKSRKSFYRLKSPYYRPIDRPKKDDGPTKEELDESVIERYTNDSDYRPKNLCDYFKRHPEQLE